jgi:BirA family biotin operon repressor/biotin-[acetyl-CoA-carboxylase] ligase
MSTQSQKSPDPVPFLDADELRATTFVRHVEIHDTLDSTNDRGKQLARETDVALPALIVARLQTAGRGRGGNKWWSADGALTFSLLLEPAAMSIQSANWPQLSLATAVALCDGLQKELDASFNPQSMLGIKWPNDVLLDGRKIAGILIESPGGAAPAKDRLVIGIGINVNNSWCNAPAGAGQHGAALCDLTGRGHDLPATLRSMINALSDRMAQLRVHDAALIQAWRQLDLLAGKTVVWEMDGRSIQGACFEVGHDGALVVDTASGRQRFYSGSVGLS